RRGRARPQVWSRGPGSELSRLRHGAARQLRAADPGRETEIVLDPARRTGLAAERSSFDQERVEPLRRSVDRCGETGRPAAHDEQVDLFAALELPADSERTEHVPA